VSNFGPILKAAWPLVSAVFLAFGVTLSPELEALVQEHIALVIVAVAGLSEITPRVRDAIANRTKK
jgi:hypothetical protein